MFRTLRKSKKARLDCLFLARIAIKRTIVRNIFNVLNVARVGLDTKRNIETNDAKYTAKIPNFGARSADNNQNFLCVSVA